MIVEIKNEAQYNLALDAAKSISEHYSQDIHLTNEIVPPYFDPLHGKHIEMSQITEHWANTLKQCTNDDDENKSMVAYLDICRGLVVSYCVHVREKCFRFKARKKISLENACHIIMIQYEQLVSKFLGMDINESDFNFAEADFNIIDNDARAETLACIHSSVKSIMFDIMSLTAIGKIVQNGNEGTDDESKQRNTICIAILPTMLRILQHFIFFLQQCILLQKDTLDASESEASKYSMAIATLTALSFCSDESLHDGKIQDSIHLSSTNLEVREILPQDWSHELTFQHILFEKDSFLQSKMFERSLDNEDVSFLKDPLVDINNVSASLCMPWLDHVTGIGFRAARSLLRTLGGLALTIDCSESKEDHIEQKQNESILNIIIQALGSNLAAQIARENFFGRLQQSNASKNKKRITSSQPRGFRTNGGEIGMSAVISRFSSTHATPKTDMDEERDKEFPARLASTSRLLSAFRFPQITPSVWSNALPIICTLIDHYTGSYQAIGSSLLLLLLNATTSTSFISSICHGQNTVENSTIVQILSLSCRTCNIAVPLTILSKTRCLLFETIPSDNNVNKLRRAAVSEIFTQIQKNSYCGPGGKTEDLELICGMLVASLQPLLNHLAKLPDANLTELARLGLITLLPLIRWDSTAKKPRQIQIASIECLVSLMMGSYPIMKRHGGKIMSELAACVGRIHRDAHIHAKVFEGTRHSICEKNTSKGTVTDAGTKCLMLASTNAASISLVLCGSRANEILVKIENGNYSDDFVKWCQEVRSRAAAIMKNQET